MHNHCHRFLISSTATTARELAAGDAGCSLGVPGLVPWGRWSAVCSALSNTVTGVTTHHGALTSTALPKRCHCSEAGLHVLNGRRRDSAILVNSCRSYPSQQHLRNYSTGKNKDTVPDLQRFLKEISPDPKEARYWLKQFLNVDQEKPFAVIEVDSQVFEQLNQLEQLASAVSFLQRNALQPVLVLGEAAGSDVAHRSPSQGVRAATTAKCCAMSDALCEQNLEASILFAGSGVIHVQHKGSSASMAQIKVNPQVIRWSLARHSVPIIPACGETSDGRIVDLDLWDVTSAVTWQLQPLKVLRVNCYGGFKDERSQVIPNINLPFELPSVMAKSWCTETVAKTIDQVNSLLSDVPEDTSVVITSADKVLQELFTHHGSGTFFKFTELIMKYTTLNDVDTDHLAALMSQAFKKPLSETYFDEIKDHIHTIYVSERYTAAAVVLHIEGCAVPYLCKFVVSAQAQGEGTGNMLWDVIRQDFSRLFWRSKGKNPVNSWYFERSEGSWTIGNWMIFWYGVPSPYTMSVDLVRRASSLPESFGRPEHLTQSPSVA